MISEVHIIVPVVAPSVNHYVKHTRAGRHYLTPEGKAFKQWVWMLARQRSLFTGASETELRRLKYELEATVFLGPKQKGDGDNFWKCIADGLKEAGVIHSDAAVQDWIMHVRRDHENPRTEIRARRITEF